MYSTQKAIEYAKKYWKDYNPEYKTYKGAGGDCANFVSQCLYAGGIPMKYTKQGTYDYWYYRNGNDVTPSWKGAQSFWLFLKTNKTLPKINYIIISDSKDLQSGDLALHRTPHKGNKKDLRANHIALVDRVVNKNIYVYGHTKDQGGYENGGKWLSQKYDLFIRITGVE